MSAIPCPAGDDATTAPTRWNYCALAAAVLFFVGLGVVTEIRSAFLQRRMGDLEVYLRTGWAVRTGNNIYTVTDHNGWHYHYPPLFAILLVPFADPGPGTHQPGYLPYPLTVALWYLLSMGLLVWGVHLLASALEQRLPAPAVPGSRRWWALRFLPIIICAPSIAHTLARGQVGLLLLFLLCGMAAATLRGQSWRAGFWLAGAICLKVIPAFLLLYPLWRRDLRSLAGCAVGLIVGLALIPVLVFGPQQTVAYYEQWAEVLLLPAVGRGPDQSRAHELINVTSTHSQSFVAVLHNTLYMDPAERPDEAAPSERHVHWAAVAMLTLLTLAAVGRRVGAGPAALLFLGALVLIMILASPVCHQHYFCVALPLVMGLMAARWQRGLPHLLGAPLLLLATVNVLANALSLHPDMVLVRDLGSPLYAALLLWLSAVVLLYREKPETSATVALASGSLCSDAA